MDILKKKTSMLLIGAIGVAIVLVIIGTLLFSGMTKNQKSKEIITKATLEKIINVSELSTFEAVYNGIVQVMSKEEPTQTDYYVSYEAKVKAGIDLEKVDVSVDNKTKKISVTLPEVQITDRNVNIASLDYIFENNRANTETVSQEAYKACIEDVTNESTNETAIYELAKQNAKNIVEALINPFVEQLDSEYVLEIN